MDVHLRGGGLQSGSHEKPGASCRLRSRRAPVNALASCKTATKSFTKQRSQQEDQAARLVFPQPVNENLSWKIRVEGHTDNMGRQAANQKLSQQRAMAVMNWLVDHGVDRSRLTAKGYGDSRPLGDNSSDAARAKNRRVELIRQ